MKDIPITVIITVHDRRIFLKEAIQSVLNQTLKREYFEILVISYFNDQDIEKFCEENDVIFHVTKSVKLREKLYEGVKMASGKVLCFLEDDDLFLPEKLETIYKYMVTKHFSYYHNKHTTIDTKGGTIKNHFDCPYFNLSSVSIQKSAINLTSLLKTDLLEQFFFLSGLDNDSPVITKGKVVSRYRYHKSSSNIEHEDFNSYFVYVLKLQDDLRERIQALGSYFVQKRSRKAINCMHAANDIETFCLRLENKPSHLVQFLFSRHQYHKNNLKKLLKYSITRIFPIRMKGYYIRKRMDDFKNIQNSFSE